MLNTIEHQRGAGLIEVLTSMLILSIGVLGMVTVQSKSVQFNQSAMYESKAAIMAADLMDRMRANPSQAPRYRIGMNDTLPGAQDCTGLSADCDAGELADYDIRNWRLAIAAALPQGSGEVLETTATGGLSIYTITIQYKDERLDEATANGQANDTPPKQFVFQTAI